MNYNETAKIKRKKQLGMNPSTARARLVKAILFDMAVKLELNICFQCGKKIQSINDLTIDHKVPWLDSENPIEKYFDLKNIAFSHMFCNYSAARKDTNDCKNMWQDVRKSFKKEDEAWCSRCNQFLPFSKFSKERRNRNGIYHICKRCRSLARSK